MRHAGILSRPGLAAVVAKLAVLGLILEVSADVVTWKNAVPAEDGFLLCSRPKTATSNLIEVDSGKEYDVSGTFMREGRIGLLYFCLIPYDAGRQRIEPFHVAGLPGTETALARASEDGDSTIAVQDASKWGAIFDRSSPKPFVAFDVDSSGLFGDLPNRSVSRVTTIARVEGKSIWQVGLMTPCTKDYRAGTKVRLHHGGGGIMNIRLLPEDEMPMGQEKKLDGTIGGERLSGVGKSNRDGAFWRGTKYVRFFIMPLTGELLFKDVEIVEAR